PAPYPPEWRWPYFFVNTLSRIYLPIFLIFVLMIIFLLKEHTKHVFKKIPFFLLCLVLLNFLFQLSILFFSRSGILVIIHRIIEPTLNGYFTASLPIGNLSDFLHTYNGTILHFVYHAKAHP